MRYGFALLLTLVLLFPFDALAVNGEVIDQDLSPEGYGYTVMVVWGSHYEMGYAQGYLLSDYMIDGMEQIKSYLGPLYSAVRSSMDETTWKPDEIEDELDGMLQALEDTHPDYDVDKLDIKVANTFGDWAYGIACRSHSCWGNFTSDPVNTLSTRRLDYSIPMEGAYHHVLCAWDPDDGDPQWVNLAWPGYVTCVTGVNEFGTLTSLHDYNSSVGNPAPLSMPRCVAARYALTLPTAPDLSQHAVQVYTELQNYEAYTGSFINYYVPDGWGGVITCSRPGGFYDLRMPHPDYFGGDVLITTNAWTDGSYTPSGGTFMADYYEEGGPKDIQSHWDLMLDTGLHKMSIEYRNRKDITIWADGKLPGGRTDRLEYRWSDLFQSVIPKYRIPHRF